MNLHTRATAETFRDRYGCGDELAFDRREKQVHLLHQLMDLDGEPDLEPYDDDEFDYDVTH